MRVFTCRNGHAGNCICTLFLFTYEHNVLVYSKSRINEALYHAEPVLCIQVFLQQRNDPGHEAAREWSEDPGGCCAGICHPAMQRHCGQHACIAGQPRDKSCTIQVTTFHPKVLIPPCITSLCYRMNGQGSRGEAHGLFSALSKRPDVIGQRLCFLFDCICRRCCCGMAALCAPLDTHFWPVLAVQR